MGAVDDLMADDLEHQLTDFGESIIYRKASDTANPLTITAVVERDPPQAQAEDRKRTAAGEIEITVAVADVDAVDVTAPDQVKLPRNVGEAAVWMPVTAILEQDEAARRLAVGR